MQQQTNKHFPKKRPRVLTTLVLILIWVAALSAIAANRQDIYDWWQLRNYDVPATVSTLASQDTMTDAARHIFYVNRPEIEDKSSFSSSCPSSDREQTIVLGCYHSNQRGIFLLGVTDPRLNGVEQVTAAHEMLHAAYDRLSSTEKQRVNAMLMSYYTNGLADQRVKTTIDAYKQSEPNDIVNEMHSIFATEIATLPNDLEEYYSRYFANRQKVVSYAAAYQAEFSGRKAQISAYDEQLSALKAAINQAQANLGALQSEIESDRERLTELRDSNRLDEYNAGVPAYNAKISRFNSQAASLRLMIERYNAIVAKRNSIVQEQDQLVKALDSKTQTINQ